MAAEACPTGDEGEAPVLFRDAEGDEDDEELTETSGENDDEDEDEDEYSSEDDEDDEDVDIDSLDVDEKIRYVADLHWDKCSCQWMSALDVVLDDDEEQEHLHHFTPIAYFKYYLEKKCMCCEKYVPQLKVDETLYVEMGAVLHKQCYDQIAIEACKCCLGEMPEAVWHSFWHYGHNKAHMCLEHLVDSSTNVFILPDKYDCLLPRATFSGAMRLFRDRKRCLDEYFDKCIGRVVEFYRLVENHLSIEMNMPTAIQRIEDLEALNVKALTPTLRETFYHTAALHSEKSLAQVMYYVLIWKNGLDWNVKSHEWIKARLRTQYQFEESTVLKYVARHDENDLNLVLTTINKELHSFKNKKKKSKKAKFRL